MLHLGQDDGVAAADVPPAPRVGDEVDRLGRVAGEDDLVAVGRVDEPGDLGPRPLVCGRRLLADRVDAAMDVGVVLAVVVVDGIDDDARLLARRRRVEVDQRVPVDLAARGSGSRRGSRTGRAVPRRGSEVSVIGVGARLAGGLHGLELGAGGRLRDEQRLVGQLGLVAGLAQDRAVALLLEPQRQVLAAAT